MDGRNRRELNDMDSLSGAAVAELLGTSVPRVMRAAVRLRLRPKRSGSGRGSRVRFSTSQVDELREELGVQSPGGELSRVQLQVLAALARSGRGVLSARSVSRRAGVAPTTASRSLAELERRGLVIRESRRAALGKVREVDVLRANPLAPEWPLLTERLARVRPPAHRAVCSRRVPPELQHLFWNTAESQLDIDHAGGFIARRLIQEGNLDGLAWGAENLRAEHWRHAAQTRGLAEPARALARNLAAGAE